MPLSFTKLSRWADNDAITITPKGSTIVINNNLENTQAPQEDIIFYLNFHDLDKAFLDTFMTKIASPDAPHLHCTVDTTSVFSRKIAVRFYNNKGFTLKDNLKFLYSLTPMHSKAEANPPAIAESESTESTDTPGSNGTPITDSGVSITFADMTGEESRFLDLPNNEREFLLQGADPYITYTINYALVNGGQPTLQVKKGEGELNGSLIVEELNTIDIDKTIDGLMKEIIAEKNALTSTLPKGENEDISTDPSANEEANNAANDTNYQESLSDRLSGKGPLTFTSVVFVSSNGSTPPPPPKEPTPSDIQLAAPSNGSGNGKTAYGFFKTIVPTEDQKLKLSIDKLRSAFNSLQQHADELTRDTRARFQEKGQKINAMIADLKTSPIAYQASVNSGRIGNKTIDEWRTLFKDKDNRDVIQQHLIIEKPILLTFLVMCTLIGLVPLAIRWAMSLSSDEGNKANEVMICGHTKTQDLVNDIFSALDEVEKYPPFKDISFDDDEYIIDDVHINDQPFEKMVEFTR